jgi:rRNA-processing protein FCF1
VRIAVDSSSLISLAWSGQLALLQRAPLPLVVPAAIRHETVVEGLARGHADAAAIEQAIKDLHADPTEGGDDLTEMESTDSAVLEVGRQEGALLTNDIALGRRAANFGVRWLRTADFVVLCVRTGTLGGEQGVAAIHALHDAGRITDQLSAAYIEELR